MDDAYARKLMAKMEASEELIAELLAAFTAVPTGRQALNEMKANMREKWQQLGPVTLESHEIAKIFLETREKIIDRALQIQQAPPAPP